MRKSFWAVVGVVGAALSFLAVELAQHFGIIAGQEVYKGWRNAAIEKRYRDVADEMNRKVPMLADDITRLDSVSASDMTVTYYYTLLETSSQAGAESIGADVRKNAVEHYCGPTMTFRNDGVAVAMRYVDSNGTLLFDLRVTPNDCSGR